MNIYWKQFFTDIDKNNINNELNNDKKIDNTNNFKITRTVQQEQHIWIDEKSITTFTPLHFEKGQGFKNKDLLLHMNVYKRRLL